MEKTIGWSIPGTEESSERSLTKELVNSVCYAEDWVASPLWQLGKDNSEYLKDLSSSRILCKHRLDLISSLRSSNQGPRLIRYRICWCIGGRASKFTENRTHWGPQKIVSVERVYVEILVLYSGAERIAAGLTSPNSAKVSLASGIALRIVSWILGAYIIEPTTTKVRHQEPQNSGSPRGTIFGIRYSSAFPWNHLPPSHV